MKLAGKLSLPGWLSFFQIVLMVPASLSPGAYQVIVKSKLNTQQLRTGEFSHDLLVEG